MYPFITYKCYQLIASNWCDLFTDLQDLVLHIFSEFCYISGKKIHIVIKKWGFRLFHYASCLCLNQKKKTLHCYCTFIICSYLAGWTILTVYFYSMRNYLSQKQYFPSKLPALLQFCIFFSFHPHLLFSVCIDKWRWDGRVLPGLWI